MCSFHIHIHKCNRLACFESIYSMALSTNHLKFIHVSCFPQDRLQCSWKKIMLEVSFVRYQRVVIQQGLPFVPSPTTGATMCTMYQVIQQGLPCVPSHTTGASMCTKSYNRDYHVYQVLQQRLPCVPSVPSHTTGATMCTKSYNRGYHVYHVPSHTTGYCLYTNQAKCPLHT